MATSGVYSLACQPYNSGGGDSETCYTGCSADTEQAVLYYAGPAAAIAAPGPG